ncbi:MAG TPA: hypothetical protein VEA79_08130 [Phenylobacterium sp.]|nr:hypothetical protein [Phenylobacterium sp.]
MTTFRPTALERAFELAKSGDYATVSEVTRQLKAEGFATSQITGPSLGKQLRELCAQAVAAKSEA